MLAQKGNPTQLGTHYVVQILRDACAFPLQCAILFQTLETLLQPASDHDSDAAHTQNDSSQCRASEKPPSLPEIRKDCQVEAGTFLIPDPVSITRNHPKMVGARRHEAVESHA